MLSSVDHTNICADLSVRKIRGSGHWLSQGYHVKEI